jgi:putative molybdopterin biosynthesis protein
MIRIDIRPVWRFRSQGVERTFDFQLVAILAQLDATAKLTQAAQSAGISYRHAWNLVADWEAFFGAPLVIKEKGRGSTLTSLGRRLLWAGQRAQARLEPELENLAGEFASALNESLSEARPDLSMHASHDYAIAALRDHASASGLAIELQYKGSFDALAALRRGECDIAGFHIPEGRFGQLMAQRYAECLPLSRYRLIALATRMQGLLVRRGNPKGILAIPDLGRRGVRMINRQRGSGTRALLEFHISSHGLDRARLAGYDTEETTHGAVAALVAGRQADVGFGVEAAAAQYRLDFVPVCAERYYLACRREDLDSEPVRRLIESLRGEAYRDLVDKLRGYSALGAGEIHESFDGLSAEAPPAAAR